MSKKVIRISQSCELPITIGTIEVDTSEGSIVILMCNGPKHNANETLTITKVSNDDNNIISLFSETVLINNCNIIVFGLPRHCNFSKGKVCSIVLKSNGEDWYIIHES